jgi:4-hydroxybenzoate polyprenyltransferase
MHSHLLLAATLLATTTANSARNFFHLGPWIIVPFLIVAAIIAVPVYIVRDRRKRRDVEKEWSKAKRG